MASTALTDLTVAVLIALPEEYEVFQEVFPYKKDVSVDRWMCLEHKTPRSGLRLVSVLAEQMGSQSASTSADLAIQNFAPDLVVVLGIAGGVSSDLAVGDVCISNEVIDVLHNAKVSEKGKVSFHPDFYNVDAEVVASFAFLRTHPMLRGSYNEWQSAGAKDVGLLSSEGGIPSKPTLHIGPIACGPVSASAAFNRRLKELHRKVTAIETESGGVFQKVSIAKIPAVAIRGISDLADSDKTKLELRTKGAARRLAMLNASRLLHLQVQDSRLLTVMERHAAGRGDQEGELFSARQPSLTVVGELQQEISERLRELSPEFRARPDGFYLPVPRAVRVGYADELGGQSGNEPINILDCLLASEHTLLRLPRTFPNQALGWSLAHSLLRQQIDGKVVLPFVVKGTAIRPPKFGLVASIPEKLRGPSSEPEFIRVFIIEEPQFNSASRMKFLAAELESIAAKVIILTKAEDSAAAIDEFTRENNVADFGLAPVSFAETALFLERAFDMTPREAEVVAIRLDDTFRKFRLDAHPTYFAGLQEETLAALINANKRAELIQLAVDGLLSLIVAADRSKPNLSRTTRERFLRRLVLDMINDDHKVDDEKLSKLTADFLREYAFDVPQTEFLSPFFQNGLLYQSSGRIYFTHPYLESYLLAEALREHPKIARTYFDPATSSFNFYAFDLYCELGPDSAVIRQVQEYANSALERANRIYAGPHVYAEKGRKLTALSSVRQLSSLSAGLVSTAEKLERKETDDNVRAEKQRMLDAKRHVRSEVRSRDPAAAASLPDGVKTEFEILDGLSRALLLSSIGVGSGSEALDACTKKQLAKIVVQAGCKFSDIWTRNRLRIDFAKIREDMLSDKEIWHYIKEVGAEANEFDTIKANLEIFLHSAELNAILEPMGRVLGTISSSAGVKVLAPILDSLSLDNPMEHLMRAAWMLDVDAARGNDLLKSALADYKGSHLLRIVLASHLLWRVFWHHYKTVRANYFVVSAKRALAPLGLVPAAKRLKELERGVESRTIEGEAEEK